MYKDVDISTNHISSFNKFCTNLQHLLITWSLFWGCGALVPVLHLYCYFLLLYVLLFCCCLFHCLYLCYFSVMFVFLSWLNNWHFCCLASTLINTYWIIIIHHHHHRNFLPGVSTLEPTVIPTAQASSFRL